MWYDYLSILRNSMWIEERYGGRDRAGRGTDGDEWPGLCFFVSLFFFLSEWGFSVLDRD